MAFKAGEAARFSPPLQVSAGKEAYEPVIAAVAGGGFVVAWEQDGRVWMRRAAPARLGPAQRLDSRPSSQATLAAAADGSRLYAAWVHRDGRARHVVVSRIRTDGGRLQPAPPRSADSEAPQYDQLYPAVAVAPSGLVAAAWDDPRDGTPDVWLSWRNAGGWSDDLAVPGASGPRAQRSPVLVFDPAGPLHIAWVARAGDGRTRIFYSVGRLDGE